MPLSASTMIYECMFDKGSLVLENATLSQLMSTEYLQNQFFIIFLYKFRCIYTVKTTASGVNKEIEMTSDKCTKLCLD